MGKYVLMVITLLSMWACKSKESGKNNQQQKTEQQHAEVNEFLKAYPKLKLPFTVTDTNITKLPDTNTISYPVFTQFLPDTIFNNPFGANRKLSIHPVGKIEQKGKESYFVTLVKDKNHSAVYLSVYDKKRFIAGMPLVTSSGDKINNSASIDTKLSIVINKNYTVKDELFYKRTIYAYNNAGVFTTVLTETNEDRAKGNTALNPLDTFSKRNKYSGDYVKGSKNVLFIRDGKTAGQYLFYVHFETEDKDDPCSGELKGALKMVSDKAGVYTGSGDPCVLNMTFDANEVKVKETGSCGNYRGIKCFFNDTYLKKKPSKVSSKKK
jgi:hypothetical protein